MKFCGVSGLHESLVTVLKEELHTDVSIFCHHIEIKAHRIVLSTVSSHLYELLSGIAPGEQPVLLLHDFEPQHVRSLVSLIYEGSVNLDESNSRGLAVLLESLGISRTITVSGIPEKFEDQKSEESSTGCQSPIFSEFVDMARQNYCEVTTSDTEDAEKSFFDALKEEDPDWDGDELDSDEGETNTVECPAASCSKKFAGFQSMQTHAAKHKEPGLKYIKCRLCDEMFSQLDSRADHEKTHPSGFQNCDICGEKFFFTKRAAHMRLHRSHVCAECGKVVSDLRQHTRMHHSGLFTCDVCEKQLTSNHRLRFHKQMMHGTGKVYPCRNCSIIFETQEELDEHDKKEIKTHQVNCPVCKQTLGKKEYLNLRLHLLTHAVDETSEINDLKCRRCEREFSCAGHLQNHLIMHYMPSWSFECTKCFSVWGKVRLHMRHEATCTGKAKKRRTTEEKLTKGNKKTREGKGFASKPVARACKYCGKMITNPWSLKVHVASVHEKKLPCKRCHKIFETKPERDEHLKTHGKLDLSHACVLCDKRITYANMKNHLLSHAKLEIRDLSAPVCPTCSRVFESMVYLKNHMLSHYQPQRNIECPHCCLPVKGRSELEQHERRCEAVIGKKKRIRQRSSAKGETSTMDDEAASSEEMWQCSNCQETFTTEEECVGHIHLNHAGQG